MKWCAPSQAILPDFIIGGAMKSGTTTLHEILNQHPDVFIANNELHFFDMDNIVQHPDFNQFKRGHWSSHNLEENSASYWQWYSSQFADAKEGQLIGEDSTTYLASESALRRIAVQSKQIKLVILLRHPTARTYSQYWHMVRAGRAMFNFEDTLRLSPHSLLDRSAYLRQLNTLFRHIPREQVRVVLFEEFLSDKVQVIKGLCEFLGLDFERLPSTALDTHANHSRIPRFVWLHLLKSRFFGNGVIKQYRNHFANNSVSQEDKKTFLAVIFKKLYSAINPLEYKKPAKICPDTQRFLDEYFYRELQGLNELLGQNILSTWFDDVNSHK
jgi:hypothetical protein